MSLLNRMLTESGNWNHFDYGEYSSPESKRILSTDMGNYMALLNAAMKIASRHNFMRDELEQMARFVDNTKGDIKSRGLNRESERVFKQMQKRIGRV